MIAYRCLGCGKPDLPIEALRCPQCGEENFIPLNRPLSAPESHVEPINDKKNFRDTSTEQTGSTQHEETEPMSKYINFLKEDHGEGNDGTNAKLKWSERTGENNFRSQNINRKQKQQLENFSSNPAIKNNELQEIPNPYDQGYSLNAGHNYVRDSASPNFIIAQIEERPQSKRQNMSSVEFGVDDLSQFKNENGDIEFAGCNKCFRQYCAGQLSFNGDSKPYKCEKCLCSFSEKRLLNSHLGVHSKERPFQCGQCNYTCMWKFNFDCHILIHHTKQ